MVATYHGDGVLVSTPPGPGLLAQRAGGPVVAPRCACLILSPLAPHNLTMRPVGDSRHVGDHAPHPRPPGRCLRDARDNRIYAAADGAEFHRAAGGASFFSRRAAQYHRSTTRYAIKMMWGIDIRS